MFYFPDEIILEVSSIIHFTLMKLDIREMCRCRVTKIKNIMQKILQVCVDSI